VTATDVPATADAPATEPESPRPSRLAVVLVAVIGVAALVIAGGAGWLLHGSSSSSGVTATSVDAGFARDMSTHHTQAVTMAGYERDNTSDPELRILAFDIETGQEMQVGEMQGWLDAWALSRESSLPEMGWMGHPMAAGSLMPGMATPAQMTKLETSHGKALDILFLQLMIHHHQGGLPMAQYAMNHASEPYVRYLASRMYSLQSSELQQMEQMLAKLGGHTLPAPTD
jgi:uncharacterized protein (DUF305 family)